MKIKIVAKKDRGKGVSQSSVAYTENGSGQFGEPTIVLTSTVMRYWKKHPAHGWEHIRRTLLHELAHLQADEANPGRFIHHGKEWQKHAIALGASRYWLCRPMTMRNKKRWNQR